MTIWLLADLTAAERSLLLDLHDRNGAFLGHPSAEVAASLARLGLVEVDGNWPPDVHAEITDEGNAWLHTIGVSSLDLDPRRPAPTDPERNAWLVSFTGKYRRARIMGRGKREVSAQYVVRGMTSEAAIKKARQHHGSGIDGGLEETWTATPM